MDFYHTSRASKSKQAMKHKPHFFSVFIFAEYSKPQLAHKLALKALLIDGVMQRNALDKERRERIRALLRDKQPVDMRREQ